MKFSYKGRSVNGGIVTGVIEAADRSEAISDIRDTGVIPFSLREKKHLGFSGGGSISLFNGVKLSEKIMFTKNLAGMLRAGLSISRALQILTKQTKNKYFAGIIKILLETIDKGGTLSDGLAKHPKVFSSLFVAMVRAGEESGGLPDALIEIGINLEKTYALNRKIKSALMYPSIIIAAIFIIGILMFVFVVPTLTKTFKDLGTELPKSTKLVVGISDLISNHLLLLILGILGFVALVYMAFKLPVTKRGIDWLIVRLPVVGTMVTEANAARTTRTLSSLLSSGVTISRAIVITREVVQNVYYRRVLEKVESVVQKGEPMSSVFKENTKLYPIMVGEMIEVGEETGKLAAMLIDIAAFYEGEVEAKTKDLSTIIEPVLMIFIGAGVGFFAISMLSPMYSIMDSIK
jgi:type IV pilus assembly protein PilC